MPKAKPFTTSREVRRFARIRARKAQFAALERKEEARAMATIEQAEQDGRAITTFTTNDKGETIAHILVFVEDAELELILTPSRTFSKDAFISQYGVEAYEACKKDNTRKGYRIA